MGQGRRDYIVPEVPLLLGLRAMGELLRGFAVTVFETQLKIEWKAVETDFILTPGAAAATMHCANCQVRAMPVPSAS